MNKGTQDESLCNHYSSSDVNRFILRKAIPITDEEGKLSSDYTFTFRVSKRGLAHEVLFNESNLGNGMINTSDAEQIFITGENPNNYIWYPGNLWRAISKDTTDNIIKLVTQWNISTIPYYNKTENYAFQGSYMESWLNDTSIDVFLGNL